MSGKNNNYNSGRPAEDLIRRKLSWKIGRKVIRHTNYDDDGNETWQNIVVNGKKYICPDLEVYDDIADDLTMRVEVKSFDRFPKDNIPFNSKHDILVVSKRQLDSYVKLQMEEEVPIFIVFIVWYDRYDNIYWASINDMISNMPKREGLYAWEVTGHTEMCYFFRAKDFYKDITNL